MGIGDWFKSLMFGSRVLKTIGGVSGSRGSLIRTELKVHVLESKDVQNPGMIGIEISAKSALSYQMMPIALTRAEVQKLIGILNEAIL